MVEKLNGIDSADVAIQATIDSINALSLLFGLAMLGLTASCITIKFNAMGWDSNRGFLESRRAVWTLNRPFLPGLNFRLCLSKVFDRGVEGDQKPFHFLNFCGFTNQKKYFKIDIERQKFFKKF